MKRKICFTLALFTVLLIAGGCEGYNMPAGSDISVTQTSEVLATDIVETTTLETTESTEKTISTDTAETTTVSSVNTERSESITEAVSESESVTVEVSPEKPFFLSLDRDLTKDDIEELRHYKYLAVFMEKAGLDITLLSELDELEELTIYQGTYPTPITTTLKYFLSDFTFLDGMNLKTLKLDCGGFDIDLNTIRLDNLETLELYHSRCTMTEDIVTLPNLKNLFAKFSDFKTINPFCSLNLELVDFYCCKVEQKNFDRINELVAAKELYFKMSFDDIEITDFSGLKNLEYLMLTMKSINFNIEIVSELTTLQFLSVRYEIMTDEQCKAFKENLPDCRLYMSDGESHFEWSGDC